MKVTTTITKLFLCCILFAASVLNSFAADKLMIVGGATPGNWDLGKVVIMQNVGNDVWKATIYLKTGTDGFKFLTDMDFTSFQYRAGDSEVTLTDGVAATLYDSDENSNDNKFKVSESANYDVVCDLVNKKLTVTKSAYQDKEVHYAALWMIGDATSGDWTISNGTLLSQHSDNPMVYSATTYLNNTGNFKIATNKYDGWGQSFFQKDKNDDTKMVLGGADNKWTVAEAATYDVEVNVADMTISLKKHYADFKADRMLILGDAVKSGWDMSNSVAMLESESGVWTATVHLAANKEFKFYAENDIFNGFQYRAAGDENVTLKEGVTASLVSSEVNRSDSKFMVAESGNYVITCNLNTNTITVKKADYQANDIAYAALWMVGDATEGGWDFSNAITMTQDASNPMVYTATTNLKEGEFQIVTNKFTGNNSDVYVSDATDATKAVLVAKDGNKNNWKITKVGKYNIALNVQNNTISIIEIESLTTAASGFATYAANYDVNYKELGLTAYAVKISSDNTKVSYTKLEDAVPANTPVLVQGAAKQTVALTPASTTASSVDTDLKMSDGNIVGDGSLIYGFTTKNGVSGFYRVQNGLTVPANKGYIQLSSAPASETKFFSFDGGEGTTGIGNIENIKKQIMLDNATIYNLAGQRVSKDYKGVIIVNGKKMVNK